MNSTFINLSLIFLRSILKVKLFKIIKFENILCHNIYHLKQKTQTLCSERTTLGGPILQLMHKIRAIICWEEGGD